MWPHMEGAPGTSGTPPGSPPSCPWRWIRWSPPLNPARARGTLLLATALALVAVAAGVFWGMWGEEQGGGWAPGGPQLHHLA